MSQLRRGRRCVSIEHRTSPGIFSTMLTRADEFKVKTTAPRQLWQTDFTYLKVIGRGWYYVARCK